LISGGLAQRDAAETRWSRWSSRAKSVTPPSPLVMTLLPTGAPSPSTNWNPGPTTRP